MGPACSGKAPHRHGDSHLVVCSPLWGRSRGSAKGDGALGTVLPGGQCVPAFIQPPLRRSNGVSQRPVLKSYPHLWGGLTESRASAAVNELRRGRAGTRLEQGWPSVLRLVSFREEGAGDLDPEPQRRRSQRPAGSPRRRGAWRGSPSPGMVLPGPAEGPAC